MLIHTAQPVYNEHSKILILGTFPSVKSREVKFFYGHPQNRFWRVLAAILKRETPLSVEQKKELLLSSQIALWDVIHSCDVTGSSDSSIKNVIPNDISMILSQCNILRIYANGQTAGKLYGRHIKPLTGRDITVLPSTSPANASYSFEKLCECWAQIIAINI